MAVNTTRMIFRGALAAALATSLSGCLLVDVNTFSGFYTPGASGSSPQGYGAVVASGEVENAAVGGVQYFAALGDGTASAYSGVTASSDVGNIVTSGEAVYLADYEVAVISNLRYSGTDMNGVSSTDSGNILLRANFADATLTGEDGALTVDGAISGGDLGGKVTYAGTGGELDGIIGQQGVVGAFHGNDGTKVFAGGFVDYSGN